LGDEGRHDGKYRAVLITITKVRHVVEDLKPFVVFRANIEKREVDPEDSVAIFNVHGTSSHFAVFLDAGKTMDDFDEEIVPYNIVISHPDRQRISTELETKALYQEALGP
jgi:hypothetical protein